MPLALALNGERWSWNSYGQNSYQQWMSNRGHAVLFVNDRGSTGLGRSFVNAVVKELSGNMHENLIGAVDDGIVDAENDFECDSVTFSCAAPKPQPAVGRLAIRSSKFGLLIRRQSGERASTFPKCYNID